MNRIFVKKDLEYHTGEFGFYSEIEEKGSQKACNIKYLIQKNYLRSDMEDEFEERKKFPLNLKATPKIEDSFILLQM